MVASDLDPKFTFESFVVGPANRLAAAAARRVSDAPGTSYNPLFIYSSSGLGKSHILNSIAHHAARVHPGFSVAYVTVESFLSELTQAIQAGSEEEFRERYGQLHILLLDDVQFFTGQKEAQEILLRLLDGMSKSGGQVVLASDRPPAEIDGLDERLLTRFSGGLIVDIAVPEYETKVAILRRKAEERGQTFEPGVAEALAKHAFTSIRTLAGALNKILAVQELEGRQVKADEIEALAGLQEERPSEGPIAGQQLLDEFGSFMEELSQTVAQRVGREEEPWRRLLQQTAEIFEKDGYSGTRLRRILESSEPPADPQQVVDQFRRDIAQLREVEKSLASAGNPWPEAAVGVLKDPERLGEAASLLASALERVRPFLRIGEGPWLDDLGSNFDEVLIKAAGQLVTEDRPEYNPLYVWSGNRENPLAIVAATARTFRGKHPLLNIAIVSAAEFAEDYIRALAEGVAGAWRERWWDVDLLALYDAELISGTERAKDELFHLLEASRRKGTKILIAADRAPSGIDNIDERLRTRFEMGLVVEALGKNLPKGAGVLNLEEAPPEFIQDDDLWGGFMRTAVSDTVIPPIEEFETGDRAGLMPTVDDSATEAAPAGKAAPAEKAAPAAEATPPAEVAEAAAAPAVPDAPEVPEAPAVPDAPEVAGTSSAWSPSKENVVWDWQVIEERIVELTELA
ncbi:MAG: ATP-binding protein [Gemmatimonadetes bacterium]|nr:ATP-binding protein [Gemmatimonadota bacterium]